MFPLWFDLTFEMTPTEKFLSVQWPDCRSQLILLFREIVRFSNFLFNKAITALTVWYVTHFCWSKKSSTAMSFHLDRRMLSMPTHYGSPVTVTTYKQLKNETLCRVIQNFDHRVVVRHRVHGGHLNDIIFQTIVIT